MSTGSFNAPVFNAVPFNGSLGAEELGAPGACLALSLALANTCALAVAQVNTCALIVTRADCGETMIKYPLGNLIRVSAEFKTAAGAFVDPGSLVVRVRHPLGGITNYVYGVATEVVRDAVGKYHMDVDAAKEGHWHCRFDGGSPGKASAEVSFNVIDSAFYYSGGALIT